MSEWFDNYTEFNNEAQEVLMKQLDCDSCGEDRGGPPAVGCERPSNHHTPEKHQVWAWMGDRWEIRGTGALLEPGDRLGGWSFGLYARERCPEGPHRGPEGPNEDLSQCSLCLSPSWSKRPANETFGHHLPDCSLPVDHESYCQPGGSGHPPAEKIRG